MVQNFKIAVIGSGTMGNGIAHVTAQSGFKTLLIDINKAQLNKALSTIKKNLDRQINKNIISESDRANIINNILLETDISNCQDIDLVIEAIPEKYNLKVSLFKKLDSICKKFNVPFERIIVNSTLNNAPKTGIIKQKIKFSYPRIFKLLKSVNYFFLISQYFSLFFLNEL